jgi:orotate phosphoribosyltransferase
MYAIFSYDFPLAKDLFEKENIPLKTLSDYPNLLPQAIESGYITDDDKKLLQVWRENPSEWKK